MCLCVCGGAEGGGGGGGWGVEWKGYGEKVCHS